MQLFLTTLILVASPVLTFAAGLVPCNPTPGADGTLQNNCGFCQFGQLIKNVSDWFVYVSGGLVVLLIVAAGARIVMSLDTDAKTAMKRLISTVLVGYMIVLGAWVLVDTVIKFLIPGSEYGVNNPLMCG
jgi:hypothetical protein